jgi:hypothetical protein
MLVKLTVSGGVAEVEEVEPVLFAALPIGLTASKKHAHEADLEDLLADNVNLVEATGDEDDTLLIIGRQVQTASGKVMDLVAFDNTGALILIEVKRDEKDVKVRKDHAEIQSVRYAASLARLRTADDLVVKLYAPYIEKYQDADHKANGGGRSSAEWARKKLGDFIDTNAIAPERINHAQKIVLIGAGFDDDTKSAAAWMAANGLPLRVIEVRPFSVGKDYVLDIQQVIPPPSSEDYYVDVTATGSARRRTAKGTETDRTSRPRLRHILKAGLVNAGDEVWFKNEPEKKAVLTKDAKCMFDGKKMSLLGFGKIVSGWGAVNIYEWMIHGPTNKLLDQLRQELESKQDAEDQIPDATGATVDALEARSTTTEAGGN